MDVQNPHGSDMNLFFTPNQNRSRVTTSPSPLRASTPRSAREPTPPPVRSLFDNLQGEVPAPQPGVQDVAPQQQLGTALEDTWVTVFGMGPEHLPLVLQEFQNCGNILQFGSFGAPKDVNWIHLKFETQHAAQRALARNGEQLAKGLVIGVKPVSPLHRQAISSFLGSGYADAPPPTVPLAVRRHRMDDSARQVASLPQSSKSMLGYLSEVIWGA